MTCQRLMTSPSDLPTRRQRAQTAGCLPSAEPMLFEFARLSTAQRSVKRAGAVMWSHLLALACALLLLPAQALADAKQKLAALAPSGLVLVMDEKGNELVVQNADKPFVPASVAKIVTAWLAMEVLGADYRFQTRFYFDGHRVLYLRGGGDPFLISEELAQL